MVGAARAIRVFQQSLGRDGPDRRDAGLVLVPFNMSVPSQLHVATASCAVHRENDLRRTANIMIILQEKEIRTHLCNPKFGTVLDDIHFN